jgi:FlaA1/EpsC-like NDP-sugar epimerase
MITFERLFLKFTTNNTPRWVVFCIDVAMCAVTYLFVTLLILNFSFNHREVAWLLTSLTVTLFFRAFAFSLTHVHQSMVRYTSANDAIRILAAVLISSLCILAFDFIIYYLYNNNEFFIPIRIIVLDFIVSLLALSSSRITYKLLYSYYRSATTKEGKVNVAIYGAGDSGVITKRSMDKDTRSHYKTVAFFDDDENKQGKKVEGVNIYNAKTDIQDVVKKHNIKVIILSVQNISPRKKKEIIELCLGLNIEVKNVPPLERWINGELSQAQFQNLDIEDLLERDKIDLDKKTISRQVSGKRILITGASGSIGSEIARQLRFFRPEKIYLLDQAESPLYELEIELREKLKFNAFEIIVADVRNEMRMENVLRTFRPHVVYHAAAYKHVPLMEDNPSEALNTNVNGTKIVSDLSVKYNVEKFVFVSTDKAVNPTNVMGCSKRIAEIYVQSLNAALEKQNGIHHTRFVTTRFGNVLGSNGSVIPVFQKQIREGGPITVTHPEITRYFMTIPEACQLVLEAGAIGHGGEIFIFDMGESVKIVDLAKKMIKLAGLELGRDIQIVFSGLRPGEKLKEELLNDAEKTIPTHHPKIMIAKVNSYQYDTANKDIEELIKLFKTQKNETIVAKMKLIVPEFVSNNSVFEALDAAFLG